MQILYIHTKHYVTYFNNLLLNFFTIVKVNLTKIKQPIKPNIYKYVIKENK